MGFSRDMIKTPEVGYDKPEQSLDEAYIQGLSERFAKTLNLVESITLVMSRIDKLSKHPQSIQIEPGLFVDRDQLLEVERARLEGFANQLIQRAKGLI